MKGILGGIYPGSLPPWSSLTAWRDSRGPAPDISPPRGRDAAGQTLSSGPRVTGGGYTAPQGGMLYKYHPPLGR